MKYLTPMTDDRILEFPERSGQWVNAQFAGLLEHENAQMRDELQELRQTVDFLNKEHAGLTIDEERLDWILDEYHGCRFFDREEVDEAMKGEV